MDIIKINAPTKIEQEINDYNKYKEDKNYENYTFAEYKEDKELWQEIYKCKYTFQNLDDSYKMEQELYPITIDGRLIINIKRKVHTEFINFRKDVLSKEKEEIFDNAKQILIYQSILEYFNYQVKRLKHYNKNYFVILEYLNKSDEIIKELWTFYTNKHKLNIKEDCGNIDPYEMHNLMIQFYNKRPKFVR